MGLRPVLIFFVWLKWKQAKINLLYKVGKVEDHSEGLTKIVEEKNAMQNTEERLIIKAVKMDRSSIHLIRPTEERFRDGAYGKRILGTTWKFSKQNFPEQKKSMDSQPSKAQHIWSKINC